MKDDHWPIDRVVKTRTKNLSNYLMSIYWLIFIYFLQSVLNCYIYDMMSWNGNTNVLLRKPPCLVKMNFNTEEFRSECANMC
jgi:hypothetical protein